MTRPEESLASIREQLEDFRRVTVDSDFHHVTSKSAWSVSQHVDHCLLVMKASLDRIHQPKPTSRRKTVVGHMVLALGWIPRGRGKSPEMVRGTRRPVEEIRDALAEVERLLDVPTAALHDGQTRVMKHPYFGGLTTAETLRFLDIHNAHHLKIIKDMFR